MLEMRPDCERCGADLPAEAPGAYICSFECTFCAQCTDDLDDLCPNCGGELMDRPTRALKLQDKFPPGRERRFGPSAGSGSAGSGSAGPGSAGPE